MPTTHVEPGSGPLLQEIANTLWKARKVVVITGAGISTNSGIPDFRSENGLYSLIQAQFDAAEQQTGGSNSDADVSDAPLGERPTKRRRFSRDESGLTSQQSREPSPPLFPGLQNRRAKEEKTERESGKGEQPRLVLPNSEMTDVDQPKEHGDNRGIAEAEAAAPQDEVATPRINRTAGLAVNKPVPLPSSPPIILNTPRPLSKAHLLDRLPQSSSPLSSPPPIMFDPYHDTTSSPSYSSDSSRPQSEEPSSLSTPLLSSQTSFASSSRNPLPVMKGKDLFDAQIWACPVKTAVFYTFVSTLRQKVRTAEPTSSHQFVSVLRDSRKLVRCYTQNIDQLEERVGLTTSLALGAGNRPLIPVPPQPTPLLHTLHLHLRTPAPNRGVECVFLHGSLAELRCFACARTSPWDEATRLADTLAGRQPICPHCAGATAAREERGKRALGVGKLRPDIVLYGEEHPHAHLISPLVQHDLSLGPDMLLILGTSMRVHGLKVLVREFARAVHDRGGKVVFVNFTKPPESVWAEVIDYWVQWDCDAWVGDLQGRKPALWLPPGAVVTEEERAKMRVPRRQSALEGEGGRRGRRGKRKSDGLVEGQKREDGGLPVQEQQALYKTTPQEMAPLSEPPKPAPKRTPKVARVPKLNPDAKRPASIRDHKLNGAYLVWKIMGDLHRITGGAARPRKSAPAALTLTSQTSNEQKVTMKSSHRAKHNTTTPASSPISHTIPQKLDDPIMFNSDHSISAAVKTRKRKQTVAWRMINGVETRVSLPTNPSPHSPPSLPPPGPPSCTRVPSFAPPRSQNSAASPTNSLPQRSPQHQRPIMAGPPLRIAR
ncbi:NAD-dependent deacetylase hst3 [Collariella sp. IMI 366227]|nr:NAD-dependent deacetylase hst3 [Collariella sp. IMI 366227]